MADYNYSGDPSTSDLDEVRFLIGDTGPDNWHLSDAEIEYSIDKRGDVYLAAATSARAISAKYADQADKSVGDLRISYSQLSKQYNELADNLVDRSGATGAIPFAGGISKDQRRQNEQDPDRVPPRFDRGQDSYLGQRGTDDERWAECP